MNEHAEGVRTMNHRYHESLEAKHLKEKLKKEAGSVVVCQSCLLTCRTQVPLSFV